MEKLNNNSISLCIGKSLNAKYFLIALILFMISFSSCESTDENISSEAIIDNKIVENSDHSNEETVISYSKDQLVIKGTDIWIRNKPITGDVVMKLNTGDVCKILEIGEEDQVYDMFDYWYKIEYKDTIGWVYGAQTNIKSSEIHSVIPFKKYLADFIEAYNNPENSLSSFAPIEFSKIFLFNPGAYCAEYYSNDLKRELSNIIQSENCFNTKPKGTFCDGYNGEKAGFYYWAIKSKELPFFLNMAVPDIKPITINLPNKYTNNTIYKVQVIVEELHFSYLYFINIGNTWYLFCEDRCDCSA